MLGRFASIFRGGVGGPERFAEFLPDAEGVVERRHSPVAGLLILTIAMVFGGMLAWAALAEVEQVVRAEGQMEPAGKVKLVNHPDGGRVAEIRVVEGQRVKAGEALVTFDPELVQTQLDELTGRFQAVTIEAARLAAEAAGTELEVEPALGSARPELVHEQSQLLEVRRHTFASRAEALAQAVERRRGELDLVGAELARLRDGHALLGEQLGAIRQLADKGLYPRLRLVAIERQGSDLAGDMSKARARREAAIAALAEASTRQGGLAEEWRANVLAELAKANAAREHLAEALTRQRAMLRNLVVRAPVEGIVQDLVVTTPGQSIGGNRPLLKLIPTEGGLVIEARVQNQDIGYLRVGLPAKIKVHAYDFLRYGTLAGAIERIDADAALDPTTGALTYGITIRIDAGDAGPARFDVLPGMTVEVDLLVGERTILSYLTDRIFRLSDAAFREG
jgi:adhesin transport system membrane fusion protein